MIQTGADINWPNKSGFTALHAAIKHGRVTVVNFLIEAGALNNATNDHDNLNTPLHYIGIFEKKAEELLRLREIGDVDYYHVELNDIAELLINNGADLNAKNADGKTPLDLITNERTKFTKIE